MCVNEHKRMGSGIETALPRAPQPPALRAAPAAAPALTSPKETLAAGDAGGTADRVKGAMSGALSAAKGFFSGAEPAQSGGHLGAKREVDVPVATKPAQAPVAPPKAAIVPPKTLPAPAVAKPAPAPAVTTRPVAQPAAPRAPSASPSTPDTTRDNTRRLVRDVGKTPEVTTLNPFIAQILQRARSEADAYQGPNKKHEKREWAHRIAMSLAEYLPNLRVDRNLSAPENRQALFRTVYQELCRELGRPEAERLCPSFLKDA